MKKNDMEEFKEGSIEEMHPSRVDRMFAIFPFFLLLSFVVTLLWGAESMEEVYMRFMYALKELFRIFDNAFFSWN